MLTDEFAAWLQNTLRRMRLKEWDERVGEFVTLVSKRDDMPALFQQFTTKTIEEARCRVVIRRAYRKRYGQHANVAHAETTIHSNFGRF